MIGSDLFIKDIRDFDSFFDKNKSDLLADLESITNDCNKDLLSIKNKFNELNNNLDSLNKKLNDTDKKIKSLISLKFAKIAFDENADILSIADIKCPTSNSVEEIENEIEKEKNIRTEIIKNINDVETNIEGLRNKFEARKQQKLDDVKSKQDEYDSSLRERIDLLRNKYISIKENEPTAIKKASPLVCPSSIPNQYIPLASVKIDELKHFDEISGEKIAAIPLIFDLCAGKNIFINIDSQSDDFYGPKIEDIIIDIVLNFYKSFPYKSLNFGAFSPRANSFQKLSNIFNGLKRQKLTIEDKLFTSQNSISHLFSTIYNKADNIKNRLLESNTSSLFDFYKDGSRNEPFQLVVLHDFISGLSEENMNALLGLISMAKICGIYFVFIDDLNNEQLDKKNKSFQNAFSKLVESSIVITATNSGFETSDGYEVVFSKLDEEASARDVYDLIVSLEKNKIDSKVLLHEDIGFGTIINELDVVETISIPIGKSDSGVWCINFDCLGKANSPLANLIIGQSGTGKSKLIDSVIINGSMIYSPDDLIFEILDFKDGLLPSTYLSEESKIPHLKVASKQCRVEEASIIIDNIIAESKRRSELFKELKKIVGTNIENIVDYNRAVVSLNNPNYKKIPRIIIAIDECQVLFDDDKMAKNAENIVRMCRSSGIHLLLSTQTLSNNMRKTTNFINGIYCFCVKNENDLDLLGKSYRPLVKELEGTHLAFASNNSGADCSKIAISFDGKNASKYAKAIRERWSDFDINTLVIGENNELILKDDSIYKRYQLKDDIFTAPIGENYVDHSCVTLSFRQEKQSGLFIVAPYDICSASIFSSIIKTAVLNDCDVKIVDASRNEDLSEFKHFSCVKYCNENEYLQLLSEVENEYRNRIKNRRAKHKPLFFVIHCSQNIDDFKNNKRFKESSPTSDINMSADTLFAAFPSANPFNTQTNITKEPENNIKGFDTLMHLVSDAYDVAIYICLHIDSMRCTNSNGDNIFNAYGNAKNKITEMDYKVVSGESAETNAEYLWNSLNKIKLASELNRNLAVFDYKTAEFIKFRFFQKGINQ